MVEKDSIKTSNNIYKVTFKTTQDELIGSIGIYIDTVTKQVVAIREKGLRLKYLTEYEFCFIIE